jgi:hypothetical protein
MEASATRAELIQLIVQAIKPWNEAYSEADVKKGVTDSLNLLCSTVPQNFSREAIKKTRQNARDVKAAAQQLERLLINATPEMKLWLKLDPVPASWRHPIFAELDSIKEQCSRAEAAQTRENNIHDWCARFGYRIVLKFSKDEPTGTDEGPYRKVTMYLYEAVTGEPDRDLRRACFDHLKQFRRAIETFKSRVQFDE